MHGSVNQAHTWHDISTWRTNCQNIWPTWHAQLLEYYKTPRWGQPGTYCFNNGWHQSGQRENVMHRFWGFDIWHGCNNGGGVWVVLTVDSWQGSWDSNAGVWRIGSWRPATAHCHCP